MMKLVPGNLSVTLLLIAGIGNFLLCLGQSTGGTHSAYCSTRQQSSLALEAEQHGFVYSENYPANMIASTKDCQLSISVCGHCMIRLTIEDLQLQNTGNCVSQGNEGSCINGCNHMLLYEPDDVNNSIHLIKPSVKIQTYVLETVTRSLFLKLCRAFTVPVKFKFKIEVREKRVIAERLTSKPMVFTSPFYPQQYRVYSGGDVYRYSFENLNPNGYLKLRFTDWNIFPQSMVKVFNTETWQNPVIIRNGTQERPFLPVTSRKVFVEFLTGQPNNSYSLQVPFEPLMVFRAEVSPTTDTDDSRYTDCGHYYKNVAGGGFTVNDNSCRNNDYLDCVHVVSRLHYSATCFNKFILRLDRVHIELDQKLTIKGNSSSEGNVLSEFTGSYHNRTGITYSQSNSYYIHFQGKCRYQGTRFTAVFLSYRDARQAVYKECSGVQTFTCRSGDMLIPGQLLCDGVRHCVDGSDEDMSLCDVSTDTAVNCDIRQQQLCSGGQSAYCPEQRCDGVRHCIYGDDEKDCTTTTSDPSSGNSFAYSWGTVIPIALVCLVVVFIVCLLVSMWSRRRKAHHTRLAHQLARHRYPGVPAIQDAPPSYNDSVLTPSQPLPSAYCNQSYMFSASDMMSPQPPPPPYSPPDQLSGNHVLRVDRYRHQAPPYSLSRPLPGNHFQGDTPPESASVEENRNTVNSYTSCDENTPQSRQSKSVSRVEEQCKEVTDTNENLAENFLGNAQASGVLKLDEEGSNHKLQATKETAV